MSDVNPISIGSFVSFSNFSTKRSSNNPLKENAQKLQEKLEIEKLREIDQKVRAHEMAHEIAGGNLVGPVHYDYVIGPNGKLYAVGGDVSIDSSPGKTPKETIEKMERVIKAALAPTDPSAQDRAVASKAAIELAKAEIEELSQKTNSNDKNDKQKSISFYT